VRGAAGSQGGRISLFEESDLISAYSRAQATEDGVLVDMSQEEFGIMAREAGFLFPFAMTHAAYSRYVALTPMAKRMGNDLLGRWWDILWMLRCRIKAKGGDCDTLLFTFYCVVDREKPRLCRLKAVIGPGDDGEPVFTLMLPEED